MKTIELSKKEGKIPANIKCTVLGWGTTSYNKLETSAVLKEAGEKTQFDFECKHIWKEHFSSPHMICTKFDKKGGVCQVKSKPYQVFKSCYRSKERSYVGMGVFQCQWHR